MDIFNQTTRCTLPSRTVSRSITSPTSTSTSSSSILQILEEDTKKLLKKEKDSLDDFFDSVEESDDELDETLPSTPSSSSPSLLSPLSPPLTPRSSSSPKVKEIPLTIPRLEHLLQKHYSLSAEESHRYYSECLSLISSLSLPKLRRSLSSIISHKGLPYVPLYDYYETKKWAHSTFSCNSASFFEKKYINKSSSTPEFLNFPQIFSLFLNECCERSSLDAGKKMILSFLLNLEAIVYDPSFSSIQELISNIKCFHTSRSEEDNKENYFYKRNTDKYSEENEEENTVNSSCSLMLIFCSILLKSMNIEMYENNKEDILKKSFFLSSPNLVIYFMLLIILNDDDEAFSILFSFLSYLFQYFFPLNGSYLMSEKEIFIIMSLISQLQLILSVLQYSVTYFLGHRGTIDNLLKISGNLSSTNYENDDELINNDDKNNEDNKNISDEGANGFNNPFTNNSSYNSSSSNYNENFPKNHKEILLLNSVMSTLHSVVLKYRFLIPLLSFSIRSFLLFLSIQNNRPDITMILISEPFANKTVSSKAKHDDSKDSTISPTTSLPDMRWNDYYNFISNYYRSDFSTSKDIKTVFSNEKKNSIIFINNKKVFFEYNRYDLGYKYVSFLNKEECHRILDKLEPGNFILFPNLSGENDVSGSFLPPTSNSTSTSLSNIEIKILLSFRTFSTINKEKIKNAVIRREKITNLLQFLIDNKNNLDQLKTEIFNKEELEQYNAITASNIESKPQSEEKEIKSLDEIVMTQKINFFYDILIKKKKNNFFIYRCGKLGPKFFLFNILKDISKIIQVPLQFKSFNAPPSSSLHDIVEINTNVVKLPSYFYLKNGSLNKFIIEIDKEKELYYAKSSKIDLNSHLYNCLHKHLANEISSIFVSNPSILHVDVSKENQYNTENETIQSSSSSTSTSSILPSTSSTFYEMKDLLTNLNSEEFKDHNPQSFGLNPHSKNSSLFLSFSNNKIDHLFQLISSLLSVRNYLNLSHNILNIIGKLWNHYLIHIEHPLCSLTSSQNFNTILIQKFLIILKKKFFFNEVLSSYYSLFHLFNYDSGLNSSTSTSNSSSNENNGNFFSISLLSSLVYYSINTESMILSYLIPSSPSPSWYFPSFLQYNKIYYSQFEKELFNIKKIRRLDENFFNFMLLNSNNINPDTFEEVKSSSDTKKKSKHVTNNTSLTSSASSFLPPFSYPSGGLSIDLSSLLTSLVLRLMRNVKLKNTRISGQGNGLNISEYLAKNVMDVSECVQVLSKWCDQYKPIIASAMATSLASSSASTNYEVKEEDLFESSTNSLPLNISRIYPYPFGQIGVLPKGSSQSSFSLTSTPPPSSNTNTSMDLFTAQLLAIIISHLSSASIPTFSTTAPSSSSTSSQQKLSISDELAYRIINLCIEKRIIKKITKSGDTAFSSTHSYYCIIDQWEVKVLTESSLMKDYIQLGRHKYSSSNSSSNSAQSSSASNHFSFLNTILPLYNVNNRKTSYEIIHSFFSSLLSSTSKSLLTPQLKKFIPKSSQFLPYAWGKEELFIWREKYKQLWKTIKCEEYLIESIGLTSSFSDPQYFFSSQTPNYSNSTTVSPSPSSIFNYQNTSSTTNSSNNLQALNKKEKKRKIFINNNKKTPSNISTFILRNNFLNTIEKYLKKNALYSRLGMSYRYVAFLQVDIYGLLEINGLKNNLDSNPIQDPDIPSLSSLGISLVPSTSQAHSHDIFSVVKLGRDQSLSSNILPYLSSNTGAISCLNNNNKSSLNGDITIENMNTIKSSSLSSLLLSSTPFSSVASTLPSSYSSIASMASVIATSSSSVTSSSSTTSSTSSSIHSKVHPDGSYMTLPRRVEVSPIGSLLNSKPTSSSSTSLAPPPLVLNNANSTCYDSRALINNISSYNEYEYRSQALFRFALPENWSSLMSAPREEGLYDLSSIKLNKDVEISTENINQNEKKEDENNNLKSLGNSCLTEDHVKELLRVETFSSSSLHSELPPSKITIGIYSRNFFNEVKIGEVNISLNNLVENNTSRDWFPLFTDPSKTGASWMVLLQSKLRFHLMMVEPLHSINSSSTSSSLSISLPISKAENLSSARIPKAKSNMFSHLEDAF